MIKAVIFDCFGVLVTSSYEPFKYKYLKNDTVLIDEFNQIENRSSRGEISLSEAHEQFANLAGKSYDEVHHYLNGNPRNAELLDYIKNNLNGKYKIGFLSNVSDDRVKELFTEEDITIFDDFVLSYQFGMAKPDPRIYKLTAERLDVKPEECIFVDDNAGYLEGAKNTGMKTVHYKDYDNFFKEIEDLRNG